MNKKYFQSNAHLPCKFSHFWTTFFLFDRQHTWCVTENCKYIMWAITQKTNIGKLIFHSLQYCTHLSWKLEQFSEERRSLHILTWDKAFMYRSPRRHSNSSKIYEIIENKIEIHFCKHFRTSWYILHKVQARPGRDDTENRIVKQLNEDLGHAHFSKLRCTKFMMWYTEFSDQQFYSNTQIFWYFCNYLTLVYDVFVNTMDEYIFFLRTEGKLSRMSWGA